MWNPISSYPTYRFSSPTVSSTGTSRPSLSHIITRPGQQMRLNGRPLKNISPGKHLPGIGIHQYPLLFHHNGPAGIFCHHTHVMAYQDYRFSSFVQHFIRARNLFRCPRSCPVVGSSSTIISGSMDNMEATASLCLWPRLSECGSIDEVLLNIKMRAQINGIIAEAGRTSVKSNL